MIFNFFLKGTLCFTLVYGEICYIGQRTVNGRGLHWLLTTPDPCQCTRLDIIPENMENNDDKVVSTNDIDSIRQMLHLTCESSGM